MIRVQESTHLGPVGSRRTGRAGTHAWCGLWIPGTAGTLAAPATANFGRTLFIYADQNVSSKFAALKLEPPGSHRDISKIAFVEEVKDDIAPAG